MRLIDADALRECIDSLQTYKLFDDELTENLITVNDAHYAIDHMPTFDTVQHYSHVCESGEQPN